MTVGEHFAGVAKDYDRFRTLDPSTMDAWIDAIVRMGDLGRGNQLLDIGAGTGRLAVPFMARGFRVVALDASREMLREARAKDPDLPMVLADAHALPFPRRHFDAALLAFVLQHLARRTIVLREAARVARSVVVLTFIPEGLGEDILGEAFPSLPQVDARRFPSVEELESILAGLGMATSREGLSFVRSWTTEEFLQAVRGRYISTLSMLPGEEFQRGLSFLQRELPRRHGHGSFERTSRVAVIGGRPRRRDGSGTRRSTPAPSGPYPRVSRRSA